MSDHNEVERKKAERDRVLYGTGFLRERHGVLEHIPATEILMVSGTAPDDPKTIDELRQWLKDNR